ncbi:inorganic phosphate transporter [Alphaproteobacteria bacterium]|nr:inorganic phosphate transporter [Alphaproteobacteria bacterium]
MELTILLFLFGGLFLGWSLGANDAANVFGTAVGTRMVTFKTAAIICSIFVILGSVISGAGTTETIGKLGAINALPGAFACCVAAGLSVYLMTKFGLPVSTTQAIVGAIIGWNLFTGSSTDLRVLTTILATWVLCPILAGLIAIGIFLVVKKIIANSKIHILRLDAYTRMALLLAGAFGAYSLGANNIANVMGVFVNISPFTDINISSFFIFKSTQQLFLLGGLAIALGVFTYSKKVMFTVGNDLMKLSPLSAFVVVLSHSIVLFLFASQGISNFLISLDLPSLPLVPVSSSQAIVGGVIGIGLLKGGKEVKWSVAGKISIGWIILPLITMIIAMIILYLLKFMFNLNVVF